MRGQSILSLDDLTPDEIEGLLDIAAHFAREGIEGYAIPQHLAGDITAGLHIGSKHFVGSDDGGCASRPLPFP